MKNPLLDKDFLYELNQNLHKEIYAKIIALNFEEHPLEQIEGRVISGSINIDGASAVRRSCNLSLVAKDINITDFYWGVANKFSLYIGVKNNIKSDYPEIIWFKQGIFVIASFNCQLSNNNYSISIGGKDKMCLLNGDIGGSLPSSIDFGKIDSYKDKYSRATIEDKTQYVANKYYIYSKGEYILSTDKYSSSTQYYIKDTLLDQESLTLEDIIRESVHTYGKEMYHNIIINDLDDYGLELMEYRGDVPLYLLYDEESSIYTQIVIDGKFAVNLARKNMLQEYEPSGEYEIITNLIFNNAVDDFNNERSKFFLEDNKLYSATKIEYGDVAGYRLTDLVYAGDLISSIGEALTSILDKIKNMLGAFEYFYDLDGRFIFQRKKVYSQQSWSPLVQADGNIFARDIVEESPYSYSFEDVNLIQKFQNTPAINNLKNDYSIWGTRKTADGAEIPIHARYAIQDKPKYYKAFDEKIYCSDEAILEEVKNKEKDKLIENLLERINNFKPQYSLPAELIAPQRQDDGSWSPGWWDIRDWHDYYVALRQQEPTSTMKWYSQNDATGCQRLLDVFPNYSSSAYYQSRYIWLIIMEPGKANPNIQHGSGSPDGIGSTCTRYDSYLSPDGEVITKISDPVERKYFVPPYNGCTDTHTYLEFLKNDVEEDGNTVYFFNPKFPSVNSFEEAVQDQIEKEFEDMLNNGTINMVDWREVIYQMALDYFKYNTEPNFQYNLIQNNYHPDGINNFYPTGETGYEIFYTDIQGFWRQLYNPKPDINYDTEGGYYSQEKIYENGKDTYRIEYVWNPFSEKDTFSCDYYLKGEPEEGVSPEDQNYSLTNYYWNKNIVIAPNLLNFWLDFYEGNEMLSQYSIRAIGDRPKVVNNSKITSIYFRNIPQVIFTDAENYNSDNIKTGYTYIWLPTEMQDLFSISSQGKSAEEEMNELFNTHSYCSESISLTTIPIYYLEPNTLIYVHNEENKINGKYQVSKLTVPLTYNGTMSITANKVMDTIY